MEAGDVMPHDWLRLYEAHNVYEWKLQLARSLVDPWGDDRADRRAAHNTMAASGCTEHEVFLALKNYMGLDEELDNPVVGPAAMRQAMEQM